MKMRFNQKENEQSLNEEKLFSETENLRTLFSRFVLEKNAKIR